MIILIIIILVTGIIGAVISSKFNKKENSNKAKTTNVPTVDFNNSIEAKICGALGFVITIVLALLTDAGMLASFICAVILFALGSFIGMKITEIRVQKKHQVNI